MRRREKIKRAFENNTSLVELYDKMKETALSLPQLEVLDRKLLEKYLKFFFSKNTIEQIKDICKNNTMNEKGLLDILKLSVGFTIDEVSPIPKDGITKKYDSKIYLPSLLASDILNVFSSVFSNSRPHFCFS